MKCSLFIFVLDNEKAPEINQGLSSLPYRNMRGAGVMHQCGIIFLPPDKLD